MSTRQPNQLSLFRQPATRPMPPFVRSATSRAAAIAMEPRADAQQARVLGFIRSRGQAGATRHEVAEGLAIPLSSVCARVSSVGGLLKTGKVAEHGTREGPFGQTVAVLVAAEFLKSERN